MNKTMDELQKKAFYHATGLLEKYDSSACYQALRIILQDAGIDEKKANAIESQLWDKEQVKNKPVAEAYDWLRTLQKSIKLT